MSSVIKSGNSKQNWPENYRKGAEQAKDARIRAFYEAGCPSPDTPVRAGRGPGEPESRL